jgi:hypothetical protein
VLLDFPAAAANEGRQLTSQVARETESSLRITDTVFVVTRDDGSAQIAAIMPETPADAAEQTLHRIADGILAGLMSDGIGAKPRTVAQVVTLRVGALGAPQRPVRTAATTSDAAAFVEEAVAQTQERTTHDR